MKKITALGLSAATYLTIALPASAKSINLCPDGGVGNNEFSALCKLSLDSGNVIPNLINLAFVVATVVALGFLIFGGIKWITSGGEKEGVEESRKMIIAALVGLAVTFLAYFLINIVFTIFGLSYDSIFSVGNLQIFK